MKQTMLAVLITTTLGWTSEGAFTVSVATYPEFPKAGQKVMVMFTVTDAQNKPVATMTPMHTKPMHLILVSDDLSYFEHRHPLFCGSCKNWRTTLTFPWKGSYKAFLEFTPVGHQPQIKNLPLAIGGSPTHQKVSLAPSSPIQTVGNYRAIVTLPPGGLQPKKVSHLKFRVEDKITKAPIKNIQPWLGAPGHAMMVSKDGKTFLHRHATTSMGSGGGHSGHSMGSAGAASGPDLHVQVSFPKGGLYKVWLQFQHKGAVQTIPFGVNVGPK